MIGCAAKQQRQEDDSAPLPAYAVSLRMALQYESLTSALSSKRGPFAIGAFPRRPSQIRLRRLQVVERRGEVTSREQDCAAARA